MTRTTVTTYSKAVAIAETYGVPAAAVTPAARQGVANDVYFLGDQLVLRIAHQDTKRDLCREAMVIPVARTLGVATPELLLFDGSCADKDSRDVPHMVITRVAGADLDTIDEPADALAKSYREVGRQLARLHSSDLSSPPDLVEPDPQTSPFPAIEQLVAAGLINQQNADWLRSLFQRLEPHLTQAITPTLIHGDVAPQNVLVDPTDLTLVALIDWGDAAWADPAVDFAKVPLWHLPATLEGYLNERPTAEPEGMAAQIIWHHLNWALGVDRPPSHASHWSAQPLARLIHVFQFLSSRPPAPWNLLTP
ncbi:aminoglycoside phosphotransferase family protein [Actinopolymorpha alba]|uniref:aminoglycoside phosphotransferase family protein n=1 Tax=Actinopolymorpha alba TaxID=533267 RepID=UPI00037FD51C|nr:aminoglycoside phosphotransferase family protein [Actinopolymorpha alba]